MIRHNLIFWHDFKHHVNTIIHFYDSWKNLFVHKFWRSLVTVGLYFKQLNNLVKNFTSEWVSKILKIMFQKIIILVTVFPSSLRINCEVLRNDDFTEFPAIFRVQGPSRFFGERTLIETDILSFEGCLYSCMLYLKWRFVNYHKDQKICELLANVTTNQREIGWLSSKVTIGDVSILQFPFKYKIRIPSQHLIVQS